MCGEMGVIGGPKKDNGEEKVAPFLASVKEAVKDRTAHVL